MVQHAVDITTLKHKLQKQQSDMEKLEKKYTEDMKDARTRNKEDMERLEKKHDNEITKVITKCAGDIQRLGMNLKPNVLLT